MTRRLERPEQTAGPEVQATEDAVRQRVGERWPEWFPELSGDGKVTLRLLSSRPGARLYAVHLTSAMAAPQILAKVRPAGAGARGRREPARPRLSPSRLSPGELTGLEYAALQSIAAGVAGDARFAAVRPLDHLEEHNTILMDFVQARTLRDVLVTQSRIGIGGRRTPVDSGAAWPRVGAWLQVFQRSAGPGVLDARQETRQAVVDQFHALGEFLDARLGPGAAGDLASGGAALAADVFPDVLPTAVGHGDYAPRNVFLHQDGRVAVFDPLARWAVPVYEDLCRFMVGVRLLGLQVHTRGAAYSRDQVEQIEDGLIRGFFGEGRVPTRQLRCYELLILLDKWSALVESASARGPSARLRGILLRQTSTYARAQGARVLRLAEGGAD